MIPSRMKLRRLLVSLYPHSWRQRYGGEFEALLDECLRSPLDGIDILLGALDAHLELTPAATWRGMNMVNKLRTTLLLVFTGYIGFVIGGLSFYGLVDDSPAAALMRTDAALAAAWRAVQFGAALSFLAVVAGGLPLAWAVIRRLLFRRRLLTSSRRELRWLLVPAAAFLVFAAYAAVLGAVANGWLSIPGVTARVSPGSFPLGNRILLGGLMLVFVTGAAASTASVWKVIANTGPDETEIRLPGAATSIQWYAAAFPLALLATGCMLLMLAGTLAFGRLAAVALPGWFAGYQGLLLTSTALSFTATITIMVASTALAIFGLWRGYPYRKLPTPA